MFRHILIPTDGSESSERAVRQGMEFARSIGARVTGFYAAPKFHHDILEEGAFKPIAPDLREDFDRQVKAVAEKYLDVIRRAALEAGVACECFYEFSDFPHEAIDKTAREKGCDLIFMASRGKTSGAGPLLGRETVRVLAHSAIPVLVGR